MPNLFNGLRKMSDEDIRLQIALFQSVTFGNAVKETGHRAIEKLVGFVNTFSTIASDNARIEYQITRVTDVVAEQMTALDTMSRTELDELLRVQIILKCNEISTNSVSEESSDDVLSNQAIYEAAKTYGLNLYMTYANKAQKVSDKYYETFLKKIHNSLVKETKNQAIETDRRLQKLLNEVTIEQKRDLYKRIMPKEFSGSGIGRILRLETGTKYLNEVIQFIGMEFIDMNYSSVYAIYDMMLGINRLARILLVQLVWNSVKAYGKFTIASDLLPSFISGDMRDVQALEEKEYRMLLEKRLELEKTIETYHNKIEKLNEDIISNEKKIHAETTEYEESKKAFDKSLEDRHKLEKMQEELSLLMSEYEQAFNDADRQILFKATQLESVWKAYFYKFIFVKDIFSVIVADFSKGELMNIEEFLKEVHDSMDPLAYGVIVQKDESKNESQDEVIRYARCYVANGKNAYIEYNNLNILTIHKA